MTVEKERLFVTLTKPYLDVLAWLVRAGFFRDRQTAIRAGVRLLSKEFKIPPFYPEEEETEVQDVTPDLGAWEELVNMEEEVEEGTG